MSNVIIRRAEQSDLPALLDIYNHYVLHTAISFDLEPLTLEKRRAWFAQFTLDGPYQCFVAAEDGRIIGWACSARFKERAAYDSSIETSVYLAPDRTGRGIGRKLYDALFAALPGTGLHRAYAGITQPNEASVAVHRAVGFELVGVYREVGRKFGRYWDVAVYGKPLF